MGLQGIAVTVKRREAGQRREIHMKAHLIQRYIEGLGDVCALFEEASARRLLGAGKGTLLGLRKSQGDCFNLRSYFKAQDAENRGKKQNRSKEARAKRKKNYPDV
jgi:prophage tail gpP-like protein